MRDGIVFIVITLVLAYVSRASLRKPGSHGFYRFIAWECILLIFVMDLDTWYDDVYSPHQIFAGLLFFISLLLMLSGLVLLHLSGKPNAARNDTPLIGFEKTTQLVTHGIYRHIRHPLYASLLFLCWGLFFKDVSLIGGGTAGIANFFLVATARAEEIENLNYFGEAYRQYMKRSKMFVPFIL